MRRASPASFALARDEVEVIDGAVAGLIAQGDALAQIVVVDDRSTDGTTEHLRAAASACDRLVVLDGTGPAAGECGKPAALRDAVRHAAPATKWLLFVDADVVLREGAVGALVAAAEDAGADLVTGFPHMTLGTAVEKVVLPAVGAVVVARHNPRRVEDPTRNEAFANGQLVLARRAVYERAGGHASVVAEILEDVRLAERVKATGGKLLVADVRHLASTRMYTSWSELREGFSKNLYLLMGSSRQATWFWVATTIVMGWSLVALPFIAGWPIGVGAYLAILGMQVTLRLIGGAPAPWAVLAPVGATATAYLLLRSMRLHTTGAAIPWKGRAY